jgi:hypothetical protein
MQTKHIIGHFEGFFDSYIEVGLIILSFKYTVARIFSLSTYMKTTYVQKSHPSRVKP